MVDYFERRGSRRYPAAVGLRWRVQGKWARRAQHATIVDLSRSGARIRAPADDAITVGSLVDINIGTGRGVLEVRRIEASREPSVAYYGVQFFEVDYRLQELILQLTQEDRTTSESTGRASKGDS